MLTIFAELSWCRTVCVEKKTQVEDYIQKNIVKEIYIISPKKKKSLCFRCREMCKVMQCAIKKLKLVEPKIITLKH